MVYYLAHIQHFSFFCPFSYLSSIFQDCVFSECKPFLKNKEQEPCVSHLLPQECHVTNHRTSVAVDNCFCVTCLEYTGSAHLGWPHLDDLGVTSCNLSRLAAAGATEGTWSCPRGLSSFGWPAQVCPSDSDGRGLREQAETCKCSQG